MDQFKSSKNAGSAFLQKNTNTAGLRKIQAFRRVKTTGEFLLSPSVNGIPSVQKSNNSGMLNLMVVIVDPKLDSIERNQTLSGKAIVAKNLFSNYRKSH